ncbi:MAG: TIGR01777 family protein [candidate division Zixibacteria bacterium]|nr:TIGR01777 family protein [candidate division Zixibacteria bacterium]
MQILITGGTGFIGQALVPSLAGRGHAVRVLSRRTAPPTGWPPNVNLVSWAGPPDPIPASALAGVDAVVNLAGESIGGGRWTQRRKDLIFASRIDTTRTLVQQIAAARVKPKVVINASAIGYYGPHGDEELSEASPPGNDFLATVCSHWEEEAKPLVRHGVRLALVRTGIVLERDGGALPKMLLPFRLGIGGPVGSGQQVMSWIHRDDLVNLYVFILQTDRLSGPINATAPAPVTNREFASVLGRVMRRPAFMPTPGFVLRLMLGEMSDLVLTGQRVLPKRALEFGFAFKYPGLSDALRTILQKIS